MAELQLSKESEDKIKEFPEVDWTKVAEEAIKAKAFELSLNSSKKLRLSILKLLASKSKLTEKDALELGNKVNEGIAKRLKEEGLI